MLRKLFLLFVLSSPVALLAQPRFASVFTDNMVVKQSDTINIWGTAGAASRVRVCASWSPRDTIVTSADPYGYWMVRIPTPKADLMPHTISCNNTVLRNVMLGEVWLCSGQSNMEWSVNNGIDDGEAQAAAAIYPHIRIMRVPCLGALTPQNRFETIWESCTPQTMRRASAVGYFFARRLVTELGVPVGIVSAAWGGANAEAFVPQDAIEKDSLLLNGRVRETATWRPIDPGSMYNQMIHPLVPFTFSGVLWYQGESNRENAHLYDHLMTTLINSWRVSFARCLPFYFVQIAPYNYTSRDILAAQVREEQMFTAQRVINTAMVVVMDKTSNVNDIHPRDKVAVGERLSEIALCELYGRQSIGYKSPVISTWRVASGSRMMIDFTNLDCDLMIQGTEVVGMTIAASDGVFHKAQAKVSKDGRSIQVWANGVNKPCYARYCFDNATIGNIFTVSGLPVAPFRTDSFEIYNSYKN